MAELREALRRQMEQPERKGIDPLQAAGSLAGGVALMALLRKRLRLDPNKAGIFAGALSKTADHDALAAARKMEAEGVNRDDIWRQTGWGKGVDGKWRYEIDDSAAAVTDFPRPPSNYELANQYARDNFGVPSVVHLPVGDIRRTEAMQYGHQMARSVEDLKKDRFPLDSLLDHDAAFKAYPDVRSIPVGRNFDSQLLGSYTPSSNTLRISSESPILGQPYDMRSTTLHEVQHAGPQRIEGFAKGGSPAGVTDILDEQIKPLNDRMAKLVERHDILRNERLQSDKPWLVDAEIAKNQRLYQELMAEREKMVSEFDRFDHYRRLAGEVEARNVQKRMNMSAAERRASTPWETQDVPDDQQIVRF